MLSVEQALQLVLEHAQVLPPAPIGTPIARALGRVLDESVISDIDSPPHDKSVVDGYAVVASDIVASGVELTILEEVTAGSMPTRPVESGCATQIMTGAPLPAGADAVVMIEQTQASGERVRILQGEVRVGQNIMRRASSFARGDTLLQPGRVLRPMDIGLLAEVGRTTVAAKPVPFAAIVATGNELVPSSVTPGPGQIRNSNEAMLFQLVNQAGGTGMPLGIVRDEPAALLEAIEKGLKYHVLLLSGGVSAGVLDLVPQVLGQLGVNEIFHKVNLKPGKPLWFGVKKMCAGHTTLVFGLPGNPVSALVCFELFVRPAIQKMRGLMPTGLTQAMGKLARDHQQRGERPTYWPAAVCGGEVMPLAWKGSGDLRTLSDANCLAFFPAGDRLFRTGEQIEVLLLDS